LFENLLACRVAFEDHVLVEADVLEGMIAVAEEEPKDKVYKY
jgi:hypothetical protein